MPNDLEDRSHNDNSSQPSEFWPPKPEASSATAAATSQPGDFRAFPAINGWIIFFLQYFTFGFYSPFWIARTARILNKLTIPEALPLSYVWGLVIALIVAVTTFFVSLFMEHIHDPRLQAVEMISKIFQFGFAVYYWVIVFRLRNALNFIVKLDFTQSWRVWFRGNILLWSTVLPNQNQCPDQSPKQAARLGSLIALDRRK